MSTINGTISNVALLSANPAGSTALDSTSVCNRLAYLVMANFGAYTGSSDTATITGILTAIGAATRNGRTLKLRAVVPAMAGLDANGQGVHMSGGSVAACTIANPTTTGDATGNLTDAAGTEVTSTSGTTVGVGVIAIVDEIIA